MQSCAASTIVGNSDETYHAYLKATRERFQTLLEGNDAPILDRLD